MLEVCVSAGGGCGGGETDDRQTTTWLLSLTVTAARFTGEGDRSVALYTLLLDSNYPLRVEPPSLSSSFNSFPPPSTPPDSPPCQARSERR